MPPGLSRPGENMPENINVARAMVESTRKAQSALARRCLSNRSSGPGLERPSDIRVPLARRICVASSSKLNPKQPQILK
jgi:hypothetical protein